MRPSAKGLSVFERWYLTVWVILCIAGGIVLGKLAPGMAKFLHVLTPITIIALLVTLVLLTNLIFWLGCWWSKPLKLTYEDAAPSAMIGASNHFEGPLPRPRCSSASRRARRSPRWSASSSRCP